MAAATGFYGTAEDVTAYLARHAIGREGLLSDPAKRLMQRKESDVPKPYPRGYGLGFILQEVNGRKLVGHSGGFPGHITQSWLDPQSGLSVSVLTNCLGGPATEWATNIVKLIDLAAKKPQGEDAPGISLASFTGRYASDWGLFDIADLGGRLVELYPGGDPELSASELRVVDADTLQPEAQAGFGSVGEALHFERDAEGKVQWIRSGGGRSWPLAAYRQRRGLS